MRLVAVLLLLACAAFPVAAQDRPRQLVGFGGGGAVGWQSGLFPVFGNSPLCGEFSADLTGSTTMWGGVMAQFPAAFSEVFGLAVGLRVTDASTLYTADPEETLVLFDNETGQPMEIAREYRFTAKESVVSLEILGHFDLGASFALLGGGWIGIRTGTSTEQIERSLDERYLYGNDRLETAMSNNLLPTFHPFSWGLQIGGSYEQRLSRKISLQPELMLRLDPGTQISEMTWLRLTVGAGVHLLFDLVPDPAPDVPPQPIVSIPEPPRPDPPVAPAAKLAASLDLRAVDAQENNLDFATVTIYQTHVRRVMPFPRSVDFARNSAALPATYRKLSGAIPSQLLVDSLAASPRDVIESHMLNLLGMRLRENPAERISLTGATSGDEATWLAYARVETVRSYLQSIWGIDAERIDVQASPEGIRRGEKSVTISGTATILAPIDLLRTDSEFEPPRIRIAPAWEATAGVRNWGIRFRHGATEIGSVDSRQSGGNGMASLNWQIVNPPAGPVVEPLSAELSVEDSSGGMISASDTLPLRLDRRSRLVFSRIDGNNRERVIYTLYPAADEQRNQELVATLARSIPAGSRLSVATMGNERRRGVELISELQRRQTLRRGVRLASQPTELDAEALAVPGSLEVEQLGSIALVVDLPAPR